MFDAEMIAKDTVARLSTEGRQAWWRREICWDYNPDGDPDNEISPEEFDGDWLEFETELDGMYR